MAREFLVKKIHNVKSDQLWFFVQKTRQFSQNETTSYSYIDWNFTHIRIGQLIN